MNIVEVLKEKREDVLAIAAKWGAHNLRVFGSVARGMADNKSDVDFLVEIEKGRSLLDHVRLTRELEELLGCKVDVVTENGLKARYREKVLKESVPL